MLVVPFELKTGAPRGPLVIVLVLEKENLDRMRQGDPFDMKTCDYLRPVMGHYSAREIDFVIAYEEDTSKILDFAQRKDIAGLMSYLERGRTIIPGDLHRPVPYRKT
jgi:hypothetical protein